MTTDPDRQARLAVQLRANLARRKQPRGSGVADVQPLADDQRAGASGADDGAAPEDR